MSQPIGELWITRSRRSPRLGEMHEIRPSSRPGQVDGDEVEAHTGDVQPPCGEHHRRHPTDTELLAATQCDERTPGSTTRACLDLAHDEQPTPSIERDDVEFAAHILHRDPVVERQDLEAVMLLEMGGGEPLPRPRESRARRDRSSAHAVIGARRPPA